MIAWQEPPPYVQFLSEAEAMGRAAHDAGVCAGMGIIVTTEARVQATGDEFIRRAVIARIDGRMLRQAIRRGSDAAEQEWEFMTDIPADLPAAQKATREQLLVEFAGDRCGGIVADYPGMADLPER